MSPVRRVRRLSLAGVSAVLLAATIVLAPPAAAARGVPNPVVAAIHLPPGFYDLRAGLGAMWAMTNDEYNYSTLYRIDPTTNHVTETVHLGYPAAAMTFGYGSIWVSDYYASKLVRLSPTGTVEASIPVGLQPQFVHVAFGSVWTSNHHAHSLTRIDPATNGVLATINVGAHLFRDGPQDFTTDRRYLYIESSNLPYLQRVDPATNTRVNLARTGFIYGGDIVWTPGPAGGTLWNQPAIASTGQILMDGYNLYGAVRISEPVPAGRVPNGIAHLDRTVYYGQNPADGTGHGLIEGVDQVTGAPQAAITIAGQVGTLRAGFGDLWNIDPNTGILQRVELTAGAAGSISLSAPRPRVSQQFRNRHVDAYCPRADHDVERLI